MSTVMSPRPTKPALRQQPVNIERYDRNPFLTDTEQRELRGLIHRIEHKERNDWVALREGPLYRLLRPILDVLNTTEVTGKAHHETVSFLLRQMHFRQTTFWAWTLEDWLSILRSSFADFQQYHHRSCRSRSPSMAIGYLLCGLTNLDSFGSFDHFSFAIQVFGHSLVEEAVQRIRDELLRRGHGDRLAKAELPNAMGHILLANRSPLLEDLTGEFLDTLRRETPLKQLKMQLGLISQALTGLGILTCPLPPNIKQGERFGHQAPLTNVPTEWAKWCKRWYDTSTFAPKTRKGAYYDLLKIGRWVAATHPDMLSPADWTREMAAESVAAIDRMKVGEWTQSNKLLPEHVGKPLMARTKVAHIISLRIFFRDCQEWNWLPRRFDTRRAFVIPRSIRALIAPDPRIVEDDIWAKLLWAGLNLTTDDLPRYCIRGKVSKIITYPLEMVRAMAVTWLFAGLRSEEFGRLRMGCVRWQREDILILETSEVLPKDAVCWLDVPVHKTGTQFTKAVDRVVGEAIVLWEKARPPLPDAADSKTNEMIQYLFAYRGHRIGKNYLNNTLIPLLCRKSGVPLQDARGNITSHRARSTIATQLFNAKEPLSLFELQEWLGHHSPSSTQSYAKLKPTKVAKSYEKAGYFGRNVRTIEVLIDQDVIKSGAAAVGEPWRFFDLGHGYCLYEFFDQCPHRMACAKCSFYRPKGSTQAQLLEGKANLLRMLQEIPLTEEERAAVEDGVGAMEKLCQQLANVPTPAGPTPNQLTTEGQTRQPVIPVEQVRRKRQSR